MICEGLSGKNGFKNKKNWELRELKRHRLEAYKEGRKVADII
jgi:hypothetical protein